MPWVVDDCSTIGAVPWTMITSPPAAMPGIFCEIVATLFAPTETLFFSTV